MKKNIENNVNENVVVEPIMDEETMKAVIEDNLSIVPKNQMKKFLALPLEKQVTKIQLYQDIQKLREDAKIRRSIPNRVKELFDKRHATVEDAKEVLDFCNEFINSAKEREIAAIDEEIAKLMQKKQAINN